MIPNVWTRACNGASSCVELQWVTASSCNNGSCIAVTCANGEVWVRDSKLGDASPVLRFTEGQWWSFVAAAKSGHAYDGPVVVTGAYDSWRMLSRDDARTMLMFDRAEIDAFRDGVRRDEFDPPALASGIHSPGGDGPGRPPGSTLAASGGDSVPA